MPAGNVSGYIALDDHIGLEERLRNAGITPTAQRLEIAGVLLGKPCHLSAEQLLQKLRAAGSRVSKATVYNTLNLFSRKGIIKEVAVDPSRLFYDSTTSRHHHFYNVDTGELADIKPDSLEITRMPELPEGMEAESVEVVIRIRSCS